MKRRVISTTFETNEKGILSVYNREDFSNFFKENPNERFSVEVKKLAKNKSSGLRAYYFAEVVPKFQIALRGIGYSFTSKQTHEFIKQFSPIMEPQIEMNGKTYTERRGLSDSDFTNSDFLSYIEDLKRFAAEEFSIIINDPHEH